ADLENQAKKFMHADGKTGMQSLLESEMPENFRVFVADPAGETSYPIITYTWILAHTKHADAKKGETIRKFLEWCLTDGQKECEALGYVRLPSAVAERVLTKVREIQ